MISPVRILAFAFCVALPAAEALARQSAALDTAPPACAGRSLVRELEGRAPDRLAAALARAAAVPNGEGLLWRIEKRGTKPSHLFGTMHATDPRVVALPQAVRDALANARVVAKEVIEQADPTAADQMAQKLVSAAATPGGDSLAFLNDAGARGAIETAVGEYGMTPQAAHYLQPWFLWVLLSTPNCELARQQAGLATLDQIVVSARAAGTRLVGLETSEEQISRLSELNELAKRAVVGAARLGQRRIDLYATLVDIYAQRRPRVLREVLAESGVHSSEELAVVDAITEQLVAQRNDRLAARAQPYLREGGAFIAVGALHLSGENGLVAQFRKAGYTLTRVW
jgi:uncharacterized protein